MGKIRLAKTFIDYSFDAISSENGKFVKGNLKEYDRLKSWRSTNTSENTIDVDLKTQENAPEIGFFNVNFTSVQILGGDSVGSYTGYDSGTVTISQDPRDKMYRLGKPLTGFNHRYLRVVIPNQSTTDGKSYFEISSLVLISASNISKFVNNPRFNLPYEVRGGERVVTLPRNRIEATKLVKFAPMQFEITENAKKDSGDTELIYTMFSFASDLVYFDFNITGESWRKYLVRNPNGLSDTWQRWKDETFNPITLIVQI